PSVGGVYLGGWKAETPSEWACGPVAGVKALGFVNLGEPPSAQIGIELENSTGLGLKIEPGHAVRARVVYRTAGKGRGSVYFQSAGGDRSVPARAVLPTSSGAWNTVDVVTTRAADKP